MTNPDDRHPPMHRPRTLRRVILTTTALALLGACSEPLDYDMRGNFANGFDTSDAATQATADRPRPDDRGIISYPGYQVAVAKRGDRLRDVANRIGADVQSLARYNGIKPDDPLRQGEIIALPNRVAEPSPATGAPATGPIQPPGVDITTLAGNAIDDADSTGAQAATGEAQTDAQVGAEPVRHKVQRGETAYSIARLYGVTPRALADWNGLDSRFTVREGQYLLIPVAKSDTQSAASTDTAALDTQTDTTAPGQGSPTPVPPSSSDPLPEDTEAAAPEDDAAEAPDLGETQTASTDSAPLMTPVKGKIIRAYAKGRNDGIDIQAPAGSGIMAADSGSVAAITSDSDEVPILVVKHADNLLTIYGNISDIRVQKGDSVSRGQRIASVRSGDANYLHFEVRKGFESVDPTDYLP
ncbi:MAG: peptidoglycan DD-metalloendopeptidase family protein [Sediminimonas sp.]|uniref:LysM peptidoglycan-binding domain-containing protein n=1 Tax=Sediminimonas sp. TaxID=2823379 RepID=UPI00287008AA|nr:LysM peptidoglycan-binding domain-containing protein [Sediminimonas sp.]MDR9485430.1 peptidoglycan DD-metalloendopeptidase family protein [Sediminimonas sp.]